MTEIPFFIKLPKYPFSIIITENDSFYSGITTAWFIFQSLRFEDPILKHNLNH
jgi:hypothetical protein